MIKVSPLSHGRRTIFFAKNQAVYSTYTPVGKGCAYYAPPDVDVQNADVKTMDDLVDILYLAVFVIGKGESV
jgi:hypothetical protein